MATLSGQRVKDAYTSLLKLESGTATSTTKVIEDGAGNDTALKLSTVKVEVNGTLGFTSAPTTGSSEVTALFLDASNNVIKRNLGSAAFTSGSSLTPVAPIAIASNVISLSAPTTLTQLTEDEAADADTFLIYDASATTYKYINFGDLTEYVGANLTLTPPGSDGQVLYNNGGAYGAATNLSYNDSPGAEQFTFTGLDFVQREAGPGTAGIFSRADSATINNGVSNGVVTTIEANLFAGAWIIDYMIYGSGGSIARTGQIHVVWNKSNLSTTPSIVDSIKTSIGVSTSSTFVFNVNITVNTLQLRASNTVGENMTVLLNGKMFYTF